MAAVAYQFVLSRQLSLDSKLQWLHDLIFISMDFRSGIFFEVRSLSKLEASSFSSVQLSLSCLSGFFNQDSRIPRTPCYSFRGSSLVLFDLSTSGAEQRLSVKIFMQNHCDGSLSPQVTQPLCRKTYDYGVLATYSRDTGNPYS